MSGRLSFPGTPRHRKRMSARRLILRLSVAVLVCVFTSYYLITPYKPPSPKFQPPADSANPGTPRTVLADTFHTVTDDILKTVLPFRHNNATVNNNATRDDLELRQSEFCTNNCNSSEIYARLWYEGRIRENSRTFQPREDADDDPYRESIETNVVTKEFRVVIKVLAFNRLESLTRCLGSLARADYGGDNVNIQIFIDHFRYDEIRRNESFHNGAVPPSDDSATEASSDGNRVKRLLWGFFDRNPVRDVKPGHVPTTVATPPDSGHGNEDDDREVVEANGSQEQDPGVVAPASAVNEYQHEGSLGSTPKVKSVNDQLDEAHEILKFVDEFWWGHGTKEIHYRTQNVGLQAQWIESWWPADLDEFAFIVEDDMELSNLYYRFLRTVVATYYYNPDQYDPSVYGVSLQRLRFVPGKGGLPLKVNNRRNLFMYPLVGTWGQLLFPRQWKEFRLWYDERKSKGERPVLEGMVTSSWYKTLGDRIWTPWFVKFAHTRGYFNLYTNFDNKRALSVSHREPGSSYKKAAGPDSQLIDTKDEGNDTALWVMSPSKSLPQFNFCFRDVTTRTLATTLPELRPLLASMEMTNNSILLVNIVGVHTALVRNWLCHMERIRLRKFVLLGHDNELTRDLSRRGYATMSTELFTGTQIPRPRRDMIAVQAVHEILALGYSVWLTRADTVWVQNPFDTRVDTQGKHNIMGSQPLDQFHPALLYIQASPGTLRVWSQWVGNMSAIARNWSNNTRGHSSGSYSSGSHSSVWLGFQDFVTSDKDCHYQALPASFFGSIRHLQTSETSTKASGKKVILLSELRDRSLSLVVRRLKAAGLWTIDKDMACERVYC